MNISLGHLHRYAIPGGKGRARAESLAHLLMAGTFIIGVTMVPWVASANSPNRLIKPAPHGLTSRNGPLPRFEQAWVAKKQAWATTVRGALLAHQAIPGAPVAPGAHRKAPHLICQAPGLAPTPWCSRSSTWAYLAANQQPQTTYYNCAPASVTEALGQLSIGENQNDASYWLDTTSNGTPWYGGGERVPGQYQTSYPVADTMNYKTNSYWYIPYAVNYYPTSQQYADYQGDLVSDILNAYPLIGAADEVTNGPHLVGHPNIPIQHWFDIRGYAQSGAETDYEDSVSGAPSVSWYKGVPPYSTLSSSYITNVIGGYGYVW